MSVHVRKTAHTMTTAVARIGVGGVTAILVARALGPQGRGAYAVLVTIVTTAVCLGGLSIDAAHTSLWSRERTRDLAAIGANSLLFGLVVGGVSAAATALVVTLLPGVAPMPGYGLVALAFAVPCGTTVAYLENVLILCQRTETVNWSGLLAAAVPCALLLPLTAGGYTTLGWVVALWTLSTALPLAVLVPAVRPRLRDRDRALARTAVVMGLRYHAGSASLFLLLRVDVLILAAFAPEALVGCYAVAVTLAELTRLTADSVAQVALSRQMDGDHGSAAALTARITRLNTLLATGSVAAMCAVAPALIPVVYGPAFGDSVAPLFALAPGMVAMGSARTIGDFLLRLHRPVLRSGIALASVAANVVLNLVLIPAYGIVGCALASTVSYGLLAFLYVVWFRAATGTPVRRLLPGRGELRHLRHPVTRPARSPAQEAGNP